MSIPPLPVFAAFAVKLSLLTAYISTAGMAGAAVAQSAARPPVPGAPSGVSAFVEVSVIPMDTDRVLPGQTVVVRDGWITALGPADKVRVPAGALKIDGRGKFLMPGLGDCHAHLGGVVSLLGMPVGNDHNLPPDSMVIHRLVRLLADGVTTIRNLDYMERRKEWPLSSDELLRLRARAAAGELRGPRIYTAGQWAPGQYTNYDATFGGVKDLPPPNLDSVAIYVAAYKAAGYDFLKIHEETSDVVEAVMKAARQVGLPVVGHMKVPLASALTGMQSIEHMIGYPNDNTTSDSLTLAVAQATKQAGVWNCVTMQAGGNSAKKVVKALHDAGAGILLGSDYPLGASVHVELKLLVKAGLTPYDALATGTKNFAQYLHALDETGTVAVGKRADLLLLDDNPLEDITKIERRAGVMLGGRWFSSDDLDDALLVFPRQWFRTAVLRAGVVTNDLSKESRQQFETHMKAFMALSDSLRAVAPASPEYGSEVQRLADALAAMREALPPPKHTAFDPVMQAWLRGQARRGHRLTVLGVADEPLPHRGSLPN